MKKSGHFYPYLFHSTILLAVGIMHAFRTEEIIRVSSGGGYCIILREWECVS